MLIAVFYHIILIIGDYVLDVFGVDTKFIESISNEDFIVFDRHKY